MADNASHYDSDEDNRIDAAPAEARQAPGASEFHDENVVEYRFLSDVTGDLSTAGSVEVSDPSGDIVNVASNFSTALQAPVQDLVAAVLAYDAAGNVFGGARPEYAIPPAGPKLQGLHVPALKDVQDYVHLTSKNLLQKQKAIDISDLRQFVASHSFEKFVAAAAKQPSVAPTATATSEPNEASQFLRKRRAQKYPNHSTDAEIARAIRTGDHGLLNSSLLAHWESKVFYGQSLEEKDLALQNLTALKGFDFTPAELAKFHLVRGQLLAETLHVVAGNPAWRAPQALATEDWILAQPTLSEYKRSSDGGVQKKTSGIALPPHPTSGVWTAHAHLGKDLLLADCENVRLFRQNSQKSWNEVENSVVPVQNVTAFVSNEHGTIVLCADRVARGINQGVPATVSQALTQSGLAFPGPNGTIVEQQIRLRALPVRYMWEYTNLTFDIDPFNDNKVLLSAGFSFTASGKDKKVQLNFAENKTLTVSVNNLSLSVTDGTNTQEVKADASISKFGISYVSGSNTLTVLANNQSHQVSGITVHATPLTTVNVSVQEFSLWTTPLPTYDLLSILHEGIPEPQQAPGLELWLPQVKTHSGEHARDFGPKQHLVSANSDQASRASQLYEQTPFRRYEDLDIDVKYGRVFGVVSSVVEQRVYLGKKNIRTNVLGQEVGSECPSNWPVNDFPNVFHNPQTGDVSFLSSTEGIVVFDTVPFGKGPVHQPKPVNTIADYWEAVQDLEDRRLTGVLASGAKEALNYYLDEFLRLSTDVRNDLIRQIVVSLKEDSPREHYLLRRYYLVLLRALGHDATQYFAPADLQSSLKSTIAYIKQNESASVVCQLNLQLVEALWLLQPQDDFEALNVRSIASRLLTRELISTIVGASKPEKIGEIWGYVRAANDTEMISAFLQATVLSPAHFSKLLSLFSKEACDELSKLPNTDDSTVLGSQTWQALVPALYLLPEYLSRDKNAKDSIEQIQSVLEKVQTQIKKLKVDSNPRVQNVQLPLAVRLATVSPSRPVRIVVPNSLSYEVVSRTSSEDPVYITVCNADGKSENIATTAAALSTPVKTTLGGVLRLSLPTWGGSNVDLSIIPTVHQQVTESSCIGQVLQIVEAQIINLVQANVTVKVEADKQNLLDQEDTFLSAGLIEDVLTDNDVDTSNELVSWSSNVFTDGTGQNRAEFCQSLFTFEAGESVDMWNGLAKTMERRMLPRIKGLEVIVRACFATMLFHDPEDDFRSIFPTLHKKVVNWGKVFAELCQGVQVEDIETAILTQDDVLSNEGAPILAMIRRARWALFSLNRAKFASANLDTRPSGEGETVVSLSNAGFKDLFRIQHDKADRDFMFKQLQSFITTDLNLEQLQNEMLKRTRLGLRRAAGLEELCHILSGSVRQGIYTSLLESGKALLGPEFHPKHFKGAGTAILGRMSHAAASFIDHLAQHTSDLNLTQLTKINSYLKKELPGGPEMLGLLAVLCHPWDNAGYQVLAKPTLKYISKFLNQEDINEDLVGGFAPAQSFVLDDGVAVDDTVSAFAGIMDHTQLSRLTPLDFAASSSDMSKTPRDDRCETFCINSGVITFSSKNPWVEAGSKASSGIYYFEVTFQSNHDGSNRLLQVGVENEKAENIVSLCNNGVLQVGDEEKTGFGVFVEGDVIGVGYLPAEKTIFFSHSGSLVTKFELANSSTIVPRFVSGCNVVVANCGRGKFAFDYTSVSEAAKVKGVTHQALSQVSFYMLHYLLGNILTEVESGNSAQPVVNAFVDASRIVIAVAANAISSSRAIAQYLETPGLAPSSIVKARSNSLLQKELLKNALSSLSYVARTAANLESKLPSGVHEALYNFFIQFFNNSISDVEELHVVLGLLRIYLPHLTPDIARQFDVTIEPETHVLYQKLLEFIRNDLDVRRKPAVNQGPVNTGPPLKAFKPVWGDRRERSYCQLSEDNRRFQGRGCSSCMCASQDDIPQGRSRITFKVARIGQPTDSENMGQTYQLGVCSPECTSYNTSYSQMQSYCNQRMMWMIGEWHQSDPANQRFQGQQLYGQNDLVTFDISRRGGHVTIDVFVKVARDGSKKKLGRCFDFDYDSSKQLGVCCFYGCDDSSCELIYQTAVASSVEIPQVTPASITSGLSIRVLQSVHASRHWNSAISNWVLNEFAKGDPEVALSILGGFPTSASVVNNAEANLQSYTVLQAKGRGVLIRPEDETSEQTPTLVSSQDLLPTLHDSAAVAHIPEGADYTPLAGALTSYIGKVHANATILRSFIADVNKQRKAIVEAEAVAANGLGDYNQLFWINQAVNKSGVTDARPGSAAGPKKAEAERTAFITDKSSVGVIVDGAGNSVARANKKAIISTAPISASETTTVHFVNQRGGRPAKESLGGEWYIGVAHQGWIEEIIASNNRQWRKLIVEGEAAADESKEEDAHSEVEEGLLSSEDRVDIEGNGNPFLENYEIQIGLGEQVNFFVRSEGQWWGGTAGTRISEEDLEALKGNCEVVRHPGWKGDTAPTWRAVTFNAEANSFLTEEITANRVVTVAEYLGAPLYLIRVRNNDTEAWTPAAWSPAEWLANVLYAPGLLPAEGEARTDVNVNSYACVEIAVFERKEEIVNKYLDSFGFSRSATELTTPAVFPIVVNRETKQVVGFGNATDTTIKALDGSNLAADENVVVPEIQEDSLEPAWQPLPSALGKIKESAFVSFDGNEFVVRNKDSGAVGILFKKSSEILFAGQTARQPAPEDLSTLEGYKLAQKKSSKASPFLFQDTNNDDNCAGLVISESISRLFVSGDAVSITADPKAATVTVAVNGVKQDAHFSGVNFGLPLAFVIVTNGATDAMVRTVLSPADTTTPRESRREFTLDRLLTDKEPKKCEITGEVLTPPYYATNHGSFLSEVAFRNWYFPQKTFCRIEEQTFHTVTSTISPSNPVPGLQVTARRLTGWTRSINVATQDPLQFIEEKLEFSANSKWKAINDDVSNVVKYKPDGDDNTIVTAALESTRRVVTFAFKFSSATPKSKGAPLGGLNFIGLPKAKDDSFGDNATEDVAFLCDVVDHSHSSYSGELSLNAAGVLFGHDELIGFALDTVTSKLFVYREGQLIGCAFHNAKNSGFCGVSTNVAGTVVEVVNAATGSMILGEDQPSSANGPAFYFGSRWLGPRANARIRVVTPSRTGPLNNFAIAGARNQGCQLDKGNRLVTFKDNNACVLSNLRIPRGTVVTFSVKWTYPGYSAGNTFNALQGFYVGAEPRLGDYDNVQNNPNVFVVTCYNNGGAAHSRWTNPPEQGTFSSEHVTVWTVDRVAHTIKLVDTRDGETMNTFNLLEGLNAEEDIWFLAAGQTASLEFISGTISSPQQIVVGLMREECSPVITQYDSAKLLRSKKFAGAAVTNFSTTVSPLNIGLRNRDGELEVTIGTDVQRIAFDKSFRWVPFIALPFEGLTAEISSVPVVLPEASILRIEEVKGHNHFRVVDAQNPSASAWCTAEDVTLPWTQYKGDVESLVNRIVFALVDGREATGTAVVKVVSTKEGPNKDVIKCEVQGGKASGRSFLIHPFDNYRFFTIADESALVSSQQAVNYAVTGMGDSNFTTASSMISALNVLRSFLRSAGGRAAFATTVGNIGPILFGNARAEVNADFTASTPDKYQLGLNISEALNKITNLQAAKESIDLPVATRNIFIEPAQLADSRTKNLLQGSIVSLPPARVVLESCQEHGIPEPAADLAGFEAHCLNSTFLVEEVQGNRATVKAADNFRLTVPVEVLQIQRIDPNRPTQAWWEAKEFTYDPVEVHKGELKAILQKYSPEQLQNLDAIINGEEELKTKSAKSFNVEAVTKDGDDESVKRFQVRVPVDTFRGIANRSSSVKVTSTPFTVFDQSFAFQAVADKANVAFGVVLEKAYATSFFGKFACEIHERAVEDASAGTKDLGDAVAFLHRFQPSIEKPCKIVSSKLLGAFAEASAVDHFDKPPTATIQDDFTLLVTFTLEKQSEGQGLTYSQSPAQGGEEDGMGTKTIRSRLNVVDEYTHISLPAHPAATLQLGKEITLPQPWHIPSRAYSEYTPEQRRFLGKTATVKAVNDNGITLQIGKSDVLYSAADLSASVEFAEFDEKTPAAVGDYLVLLRDVTEPQVAQVQEISGSGSDRRFRLETLSGDDVEGVELAQLRLVRNFVAQPHPNIKITTTRTEQGDLAVDFENLAKTRSRVVVQIFPVAGKAAPVIEKAQRIAKQSTFRVVIPKADIENYCTASPLDLGAGGSLELAVKIAGGPTGPRGPLSASCRWEGKGADGAALDFVLEADGTKCHRSDSSAWGTNMSVEQINKGKHVIEVTTWARSSCIYMGFVGPRSGCWSNRKIRDSATCTSIDFIGMDCSTQNVQALPERQTTDSSRNPMSLDGRECKVVFTLDWGKKSIECKVDGKVCWVNEKHMSVWKFCRFAVCLGDASTYVQITKWTVFGVGAPAAVAGSDGITPEAVYEIVKDAQVSFGPVPFAHDNVVLHQPTLQRLGFAPFDPKNAPPQPESEDVFVVVRSQVMSVISQCAQDLIMSSLEDHEELNALLTLAQPQYARQLFAVLAGSKNAQRVRRIVDRIAKGGSSTSRWALYDVARRALEQTTSPLALAVTEADEKATDKEKAAIEFANAERREKADLHAHLATYIITSILRHTPHAIGLLESSSVQPTIAALTAAGNVLTRSARHACVDAAATLLAQYGSYQALPDVQDRVRKVAKIADHSHPYLTAALPMSLFSPILRMTSANFQRKGKGGALLGASLGLLLSLQNLHRTFRLGGRVPGSDTKIPTKSIAVLQDAVNALESRTDLPGCFNCTFGAEVTDFRGIALEARALREDTGEAPEVTEVKDPVNVESDSETRQNASFVWSSLTHELTSTASSIPSIGKWGFSVELVGQLTVVAGVQVIGGQHFGFTIANTSDSPVSVAVEYCAAEHRLHRLSGVGGSLHVDETLEVPSDLQLAPFVRIERKTNDTARVRVCMHHRNFLQRRRGVYPLGEQGAPVDIATAIDGDMVAPASVPVLSRVFYVQLRQLLDKVEKGTNIRQLLLQYTAVKAVFDSMQITSHEAESFQPYVRHAKALADLAQVAYSIANLQQPTNPISKLFFTTKCFIPNAVREALQQEAVSGLSSPTGNRIEVQVHMMQAGVRRKTVQAGLRASIFGQLKPQIQRQITCLYAFPMFQAKLVGFGATDCGGPYRQTITELGVEMMDERNPMWRKTRNGETIMPNAELGGQYREYFNFFGQLLGHFFLHPEVLPVDISALFWRRLCGDAEAPDDISCVWRSINGLATPQILESPPELFNECFPDAVARVAVEKDISTSADEPLSAQRLRAIVWTETHRWDDQIAWIQDGFYKMVPPSITCLFTPEELELRICGAKTVTHSELQKVCDVNIGQRERFWRMSQRLTDEERSQLLEFICGSRRLPLPEGRRCSINGEGGNGFPRASTCFFNMYCPDYNSDDEMYEKVRYAITMCRSIDNDYVAQDQVIIDNAGE